MKILLRFIRSLRLLGLLVSNFFIRLWFEFLSLTNQAKADELLYSISFKRRGKQKKEPILASELGLFAQAPQAKESFGALRAQRLALQSQDKLWLRAYWIAHPDPRPVTAILVHGYGDKVFDMQYYAKLFYETFGYNVLLPVGRAHGNSEGRYLGFGWPERRDLLAWIQKVLENQGKDTQIVLFGISMGAATVLMASGEALPPQVKAVVADCAYTSIEDILAVQLKYRFKRDREPTLSRINEINKERNHFDFYEASALKALEKNKLPVLFIHGEADRFVPFPMVKYLFEAAQSEKDLLTVPEAKHAKSFKTDPEAYRKKLEGFLQRFIQT